MSHRAQMPERPAERSSLPIGRQGRRLATAVILVLLAGCEHGQLSFDNSTGQFSLPIGAGSSHEGSNR